MTADSAIREAEQTAGIAKNSRFMRRMQKQFEGRGPVTRLEYGRARKRALTKPLDS
ncbi:MAG: hypothetical protein Q7N95_07650 [Alphaproteobacteria bacterium]|nr:hypothetical protein [Alphaproteobacteria bacterium]